jgi:hypothetical protein
LDRLRRDPLAAELQARHVVGRIDLKNSRNVTMLMPARISAP